MDDKLTDARLAEFERQMTYAPRRWFFVIRELVAEIRRLRGEAQAGYEWMAKATLWEDERDNAREKVDALLAIDPFRGMFGFCPYCYGCNLEGAETGHRDDCAYQRAQQARDWEPTT